MLPTQPDPTGLVDAPIPEPLTPTEPVLTPPADRRRGWPFAFSMVLVADLGGGARFMSGYSVGRVEGRAPSGSISEVDAWKTFCNVYDAVSKRFAIGPIESSTLIEGAIRGLVESVGDPYSSYLSPEDFQGTLNDISGSFEGIGAEIGSVDAAGNSSDCATFGPDCHLVIIRPLDDSPALKAGLKAGDVVLEVDGVSLDGLTPNEARDTVPSSFSSAWICNDTEG
jgi:carboxyl-terminal processing protease